MKKLKQFSALLFLSLLFFTCGCAGPTELQKQNAWLHHRTTAIASAAARSENCSGNLQKLPPKRHFRNQAGTLPPER